MTAVVIQERAKRGARESKIGLWPRAVVRFQWEEQWNEFACLEQGSQGNAVGLSWGSHACQL